MTQAGANLSPAVARSREPALPRRAALPDPQALMRIRSLQLRAQVVVEGMLGGLHRSPYHGFSVEFSEYREYSVGDDPRYLDWRLLARSDRYYIKRFEDETNLRCYLLVDLSRSMGYGSLEWTKADYARTAAATLAYFLSSQRDAVGLITFEERIAEYLPARYRPGYLRRLMLALERSVAGSATDLSAPLEQIARTVRKRGLVVLISDLLAPVETIARQLGYLRSRGHEVAVLRTLDPAEIDFTFHNAAMFRDVESGREAYIDPDLARLDYRARFRAHDEALQQTCRDLGAAYSLLRTDRPLELALFDFVRLRRRGPGRVSASRSRAGGRRG
jgi:uncharacterized protein (DUF58 family)